MKNRFWAVSAIAFACLVPAASFASTECAGKFQNIYTGDNGTVYIMPDRGPGGYFAASNPNQKNALAIATSGMLGDKWGRWRFTANGVDCTKWDIRNDLEGIWLDK